MIATFAKTILKRLTNLSDITSQILAGDYVKQLHLKMRPFDFLRIKEL
jgi:hypothetical protein